MPRLLDKSADVSRDKKFWSIASGTVAPLDRDTTALMVTQDQARARAGAPRAQMSTGAGELRLPLTRPFPAPAASGPPVALRVPDTRPS